MRVRYHFNVILFIYTAKGERGTHSFECSTNIYSFERTFIETRYKTLLHLLPALMLHKKNKRIPRYLNTKMIYNNYTLSNAMCCHHLWLTLNISLIFSGLSTLPFQRAALSPYCFVAQAVLTVPLLLLSSSIVHTCPI